MQQTGTLPGRDGCPAAPRTCSGEAPAGISEWGVHFGVCALAINTVQVSQAQQCCGRHRRGPALASLISSMALGGGIVVLPGLHGEVAVARWLCCWKRTLGRTHAPWPWCGAILAPPEGHPCFLMALPRDRLPCGHGADPAGAAWPWGCAVPSCWAGQS